MKTRYLQLLFPGVVAIALLLPFRLPASICPGDSLYQLERWLVLTEAAFQGLRLEHSAATAAKYSRLKVLNRALKTADAQNPEYGYSLLLEKISLQEELQILESAAELKQLRLRYRKGIEMLKMLYEKLLSLDHHFTSLRTSQQIERISNPHEYPEFKELNSVLEERMKKKFGFALPALLEQNPVLSAMYSLVGMAVGGGDNRQDKSKLETIACILDFTVRMDQQLNTIYYETEFLRDANLTLKKDCESLFTDCTRQIGYTIPLNYCREHDDWENLYSRLDQYIERALAPGDAAEGLQKKATTNLQFALGRVVHFLEKYCAFISQGNEYYKKFAKIVGSYAHEESCAAILPDTFSRLKNDIEITLEKFNGAYYLPEMQGSRLKDLLYGVDE